MEDLDQDYEYICYRTHIGYTDARPRHLKLSGVADRAMVYVDGEYLATVQRDTPHPDWPILGYRATTHTLFAR